MLSEQSSPVVHNVYGPTETTIWSTSAAINRGERGIGRPLSGEDVRVLLANGHMAPLGAIGEIHIGGAGVARGYLGRPGLTADRFVPHPSLAGERVYRTGDRARWLPTGELAFAGRRDRQVKIRGHRIECGEIEAQLAGHEAVAETVVVARTVDAGRDPELVAYVRLHRPAATTELRSFLRSRLPDAMVPALWVTLDAFPRTANHKIDRRALPDPTAARERAHFAAPSTGLERALARIWQEVLGVDAIGVQDDFFDLGGHSLSATRAIARIRRELSTPIELRELFVNPTIASLARIIDAAGRQLETAIEVAPPADTDVLSYAQRRMWVLHQLDPTGVAYSVPIALRLSGRVNVPALQAAFDALLRRHHALTSVIVLVNGEPRIRQAQELPVLRVNEATSASTCTPRGRRRGRSACWTSRSSARFSRATTPASICCSSTCTTSCATAGRRRSWRASCARSTTHSPRAGPIRCRRRDFSTGDYAAWQRQRLAAGEDSDREFWLKTLAKPLPIAELPLDNPRPALRTFSGRRHTYEIDRVATRQLRSRCADTHTTLFVALTAAVDILLSRYADTTDVIVGTPVAGRAHGDLESQVGLYVNTVALRSRIGHADRVSDVLASVRDTVTAAFAHQEYPFDKLVDELGLERDPSRSPVFDVMVTYWDSAETTLRMGGVAVRPLEMPGVASKVDLTFNFTQQDDRLLASIDYNSDLYEPTRVRQMATHLGTLLRAVVDDPSQPARGVNLLSAAERRQLLEEFNHLPIATGPETLVDAFAAQARRTPERLAVVGEGRTLTYAELDARANAVAAALHGRLDAQPDDVIALAMERDERAIVAMLGVLKAGAAYLPIDPDAPPARITAMLEDAGARALIADRPRREPDRSGAGV